MSLVQYLPDETLNIKGNNKKYCEMIRNREFFLIIW